MGMRALTIEIGAGCHAILTWPNNGHVEIEVQGPDHKRIRRYHGPWTRDRIQGASSTELKHIVFLAQRTGRCPAWHNPGFVPIGEVVPLDLPGVQP